MATYTIDNSNSYVTMCFHAQPAGGDGNITSNMGVYDLVVGFNETINTADLFTTNNTERCTIFYLQCNQLDNGNNAYINLMLPNTGFNGKQMRIRTLTVGLIPGSIAYNYSVNPIVGDGNAADFSVRPTGNIVFNIVMYTGAITDPNNMTYAEINNTSNRTTVGTLTFTKSFLLRESDTNLNGTSFAQPFPITTTGSIANYSTALNTFFDFAGGFPNEFYGYYNMSANTSNSADTPTYTLPTTGSDGTPVATDNTLLYSFTSPTGGINCLAYGTNVLTPFGYKLVQDIKEGDLLSTHDGRTTKVNKVLKRTIVSNNELYLIKKDSFGINTPNDDLYLSLAHAVYYNDAFHHPFHANNENIIKVDKTCFVQFYHFEVDNYFTDFIIANNMIVETNNSNPELNKLCNYECTPGKCSIQMSGKDILPTNNEWLQLL